MIYVVTAVHNRENITKAFVEQLNKQINKDNICFLMIDDGCTDNTVSVVKSIMDKSIIISGNGSLWWGGALHEAYKWIKDHAKKEDFVMFANDDTYFSEDYISRAIELLCDKSKVLLAGYGISIQSGAMMDGAVLFSPADTSFSIRVGEGNCASTRSLFCKASDVIAIGGFHPHLLPHYWSDYEWTIRACYKKNYKVICDSNIAYYMNEESTGDNDCSIINRNQVFSKRSVANPWYKIIFIILATPKRYKIKALFKQINKYIHIRKTIMEILRR